MNSSIKGIKNRSNLFHIPLRKIYAGDVCTLCYDIPSKRVSYDIWEAKLVEYYCTNYFQYRNDGRTKKVIDKLN